MQKKVNSFTSSIYIRLIVALAITGPVLFILIFIQNYIETSLFTYPAAFVNAVYFASPLEYDGNGGYLLSAVQLHIVPGCSGYNFFVIASSLVIFQLVSHGKFFSTETVIYLLPLYPFVILINSFRIITSVYVARLVSLRMYGVAHQWSGILIFIPVLLGIYIFLERRFHHEKNRPAT